MKLIRLLVALAFVGWCVYAGVYVPAQFGMYDAPQEDAQ